MVGLEYGEVFPTLDCIPGFLANNPSSRRFRNRCGCPRVPRGWLSFGAEVQSVQKPISASGTPGGGGEVINHLIALVGRAMAIAQLTHLDSCIGGATRRGPGGMFSARSAFTGADGPRRVSFASGVTVLGGEPTVEQSTDQSSMHRPDIQIHDPVFPDIPEEDDMDISLAKSEVPLPVLKPDGNSSLFNFSKELPGWFPGGYR